jgi:hypothetical protein
MMALFRGKGEGEGRCQFHQCFMSSFLVQKFFCAAFTCLQIGFVIFGPKDSGAKTAQKCW